VGSPTLSRKQMQNTARHNRRTKIVGTLGPASIPKIKQLVIAGVNVFRLNFSHIKNPSTQQEIILEIRNISKELSIPVAILGDLGSLTLTLGGPKVRCNAFKTPFITLTTGSVVNLVTCPVSDPEILGEDGMIFTPVQSLCKQLQVGHRVLLDDGYIQLKVTEKKEFAVGSNKCEGCVCEVVQGGDLKPKKGINVPDIRLEVSALTEKDKIDAKFIWSQRLDYVALSFVQKPEDVQDLLDLFEKCNELESKSHPDLSWRPWIISKIEKPQALEDIDEIIKISDGIMVARGDLGVEVNLDSVPVIQKMLIEKCNAAGKPVITATQMLESMIHSPTPTRAEVSDVANAVFEGTDAVMLSGECAVGDFPIAAVKMMSSVCKTAEQNRKYFHTVSDQSIKEMEPFARAVPSKFVKSVANAAVLSANESGAKAIISFTNSAETPIFISKRRPMMPIIAVSSVEHIYLKLALFYGVYPIFSPALLSRNTSATPDKLRYHLLLQNTDDIIAHCEKDIMEHKELVNRAEMTSTAFPTLELNDVIVFCAGMVDNVPGLSNSVKIAEFGHALSSQNAKGHWKEALAKLKSMGLVTAKESLVLG
jgi:pyruvate kinase